MNRKLLLADDSVTIQRVVELTFSGEDIDVIAVSDGEQAIARIPIEKPDIVLADIAMPKKNGYEVASFVKEHPTLSHVPVLLLAGAFEPVDDRRAKAVKSDGVLVKPFETHEVIVRVRELIGGKSSADRSSSSNVVPMPSKEAPAPPAAEKSDESLDAYFDRLDATFANRVTPPAPPAELSRSDRTAAAPIPTVSAVLTPVEIEDEETGNGDVVSHLFRVLFAVEQGERDIADVRLPETIERIRKRSARE